MTEKNYPTDLEHCQWLALLPLLPKPKSGKGLPGRKPYDLRLVLNAIFYVNKTGCQWRLLPKDFGHWNTIYGYFNRFSKLGLWQTIMETLTKEERLLQGRKQEPSAACIDSQTVKIYTQGEEVGYDGNKKIKGRKRHILTDTIGLLLAVFVSAASVGDREGLKELLWRYYTSSGLRRLKKIWVDQGYEGSELKDWVKSWKGTHQVDLEVGKREGKGFQLDKKRWVVERTFSWIFNYRRHSKDYEKQTCNSEAMIQITMIQILLHRF